MNRALKLLPLTILLVAGPLVAQLVPSNMVKSLLVQATIYSIYAIGIGMLIRQNGMVSFGHAAFFGLPGYLIGALLPLKLMPVEFLILGAVLATGLLAFAVGLVVVRIHGIAFGMLTLAIGQAVYEAATRMRGVTGGHDGMSLRFPREIFGTTIKTFQQPTTMLMVAWSMLAAVLILVTWFGKSSYGIRTEAIRDNEERARFLGYKTLVPRALVFGLSALVTAASGALFALYNGFVSPETVHWTASGSTLIMTILGGFTTAWGPVLGTFVYFFLKEFVGGFTTHWLTIIGVCLILVTVAFPTGLAGVLRRLLSANSNAEGVSHAKP